MKKPLLFLTAFLVFSAALLAQPKKQPARLSYSLQKIIEQPQQDSIDIVFTIKDPGQFARLKSAIKPIRIHQSSQTIIVRVATKDIERFVQTNSIEFADVLRKPKEELTTGAFDISLNKLNLVHHLYPAFDGSSINASVKEQLLDSTDIDIKGRYFNSGVAAPAQTSHAAIMATILAGAGNSSPYAVGAAMGARVTSSSFASLLPDADTVYTHYKISVQNHSYGTGIENYYGADARAYDISVNHTPSLLHVFSAGNSGTSTSGNGPYAGVQGFANLTGSFKMAKNIITVGSVDSFNNIMPLSSRGPAYDGRVKPELVAYGEDGSSGAAALTSGTAALLQQVYQQQHHDSLPSAALVKAVLLNSADDVGPKGIDYVSGYGSVNGFNGMKTMLASHFFESTVSQNEVKRFELFIPPHTQQVKLTLAWSDTAAAANAVKALVNDIDAVLKLPATGESWQPWVLNAYPHKDSLLLPAVRQRDSLNTVEQITVDHPQAGNYVIEVKGQTVTADQQAFAIAFQIDTADTFTWTYPTGSDVVKAGTVATLRWQTNIANDALIEYSLDGANWQAITPPGFVQQQYTNWLIPDTLSKALLRCRIPSLNQTIVSDTFVISKPLNLQIGFNCTDSFLLYWNQLPATGYQVYALGAKYLEPVTITSDTLTVFQKNNHPSLYYAVAPLVANKPGLRSYTLNYTTQGVGCYLRTFYATLQNHQSQLLAELGSLYNVASIAFQQLTPTGYQTISTVSHPSSLIQTYSDSSLIQGANFYRFAITLANGQTIYSPVDQVYYLPGNPVLVYPNPARSGEAIKIITQEPGNYTLAIFDVNGRLVKTFFVEDILQPLPLVQLSTGMYFIKIISNDGKVFHQKLIVY